MAQTLLSNYGEVPLQNSISQYSSTCAALSDAFVLSAVMVHTNNQLRNE